MSVRNLWVNNAEVWCAVWEWSLFMKWEPVLLWVSLAVKSQTAFQHDPTGTCTSPDHNLSQVLLNFILGSNDPTFCGRERINNEINSHDTFTYEELQPACVQVKQGDPIKRIKTFAQLKVNHRAESRTCEESMGLNVVQSHIFQNVFKPSVGPLGADSSTKNAIN